MGVDDLTLEQLGLTVKDGKLEDLPVPQVLSEPRSFSGGSGENRNATFEGLQIAGSSPTATAALMGDAEQESSFKPTLVGDGGTSFGTWQVGRDLFKRFDEGQVMQGVPRGSPEYARNQATFMADYYSRQHPDRWAAMQNADSPQMALDIFRSTPGWGREPAKRLG